MREMGRESLSRVPHRFSGGRHEFLANRCLPRSRASGAWMLVGAVCILWGLCPATDAGEGHQRPNVVLILADDLGCETLGCYGGTSYRTPNLDTLAQTGIRYRHCYSMPMCYPSRVCLLTGRYPSQLGHPRWGTFPKSQERRTFAHVMKSRGYVTAVAGKWQLTLLKNDPDQPHRLGFDAYCLFGWHEGPRYYQPLIWQNGKIRSDVKDRYGPDVYCEFLIDFVKRNKDRPFLVYYPMALCHDVTNDLDAPPPFGPNGRWQTYGEMVEAMDERVGRLVKAIDRLRLRQRTLILFTADNGTPVQYITGVAGGKYVRTAIVSKMGDVAVRGGKWSLTDGGTHVPLIANWLGKLPGGRITDDLVDFSDFLPTLADLCGGALPAGVVLDGKSFASGLLGKSSPARQWAYSEKGEDRYWVRTQRWKLYNCGALYDLRNDPHEKTPVQGARSDEADAARVKLAPILRKLRTR